MTLLPCDFPQAAKPVPDTVQELPNGRITQRWEDPDGTPYEVVKLPPHEKHPNCGIDRVLCFRIIA